MEKEQCLVAGHKGTKAAAVVGLRSKRAREGGGWTSTQESSA